MNESGNNEFKMGVSQWRGYVTRALEENDGDHKKISESIGRLHEKIDKIDSKFSNLRVRVAGVSATVSLVVIILFLVLREFIK